MGLPTGIGISKRPTVGNYRTSKFSDDGDLGSPCRCGPVWLMTSFRLLLL